jgi:hypothetical protein
MFPLFGGAEWSCGTVGLLGKEEVAKILSAPLLAPPYFLGFLSFGAGADGGKGASSSSSSSSTTTRNDNDNNRISKAALA